MSCYLFCNIAGAFYPFGAPMQIYSLIPLKQDNFSIILAGVSRSYRLCIDFKRSKSFLKMLPKLVRICNTELVINIIF